MAHCVQQWMNSKAILTLDTSEKAHLVDVRSAEELEVGSQVIQLDFTVRICSRIQISSNNSRKCNSLYLLGVSRSSTYQTWSLFTAPVSTSRSLLVVTSAKL
jgi:hypothetical protein